MSSDIFDLQLKNLERKIEDIFRKKRIDDIFHCFNTMILVFTIIFVSYTAYTNKNRVAELEKAIQENAPDEVWSKKLKIER